MAALFSKKRSLADIMAGFRDIHCHLLPGVDDGSPDAEYSRRGLGELERLGVRAVYLTPHIINGMYDNRNEAALRETFSGFEYNGGMGLRLAAEYLIDDKFVGRFTDNDPLTFADRHILCEFEMNFYNTDAFNRLLEVSQAGYNIIIAHPERYSFIQRDRRREVIKTLAARGYKLQLNLLSLAGYHGRAAEKLARELLEEGLYDFVGTDTHSLSYLQALERLRVPEKIYLRLERLRENNVALF